MGRRKGNPFHSCRSSRSSPRYGKDPSVCIPCCRCIAVGCSCCGEKRGVKEMGKSHLSLSAALDMPVVSRASSESIRLVAAVRERCEFHRKRLTPPPHPIEEDERSKLRMGLKWTVKKTPSLYYRVQGITQQVGVPRTGSSGSAGRPIGLQQPGGNHATCTTHSCFLPTPTDLEDAAVPLPYPSLS